MDYRHSLQGPGHVDDPRVRFTLQRLMVAVALLGALAWGIIEGERKRARFHALSTRYATLEARLSLWHGSVPDGDYWERKMREIAERRAVYGPYYAALMRKYRRAERYPWLPVAPEPPAPK